MRSSTHEFFQFSSLSFQAHDIFHPVAATTDVYSVDLSTDVVIGDALSSTVGVTAPEVDSGRRTDLSTDVVKSEVLSSTVGVTTEDVDSGLRSLSTQPLSTSDEGALPDTVYTSSEDSFIATTNNVVNEETCCDTTADVTAVNVSDSSEKSDAAGPSLCTPLAVMVIAIAFWTGDNTSLKLGCTLDG
jgi:hypothetical protein